MIQPIIESAFPILHQIENEPTADILRLAQTNDPFTDPHQNLPKYETVMANIPVLFTQSSQVADKSTNKTTSSTSLYFLRKDLTEDITDRMLFEFNNSIYTPLPGGILNTFGLIEVTVEQTK